MIAAVIAKAETVEEINISSVKNSDNRRGLKHDMLTFEDAGMQEGKEGKTNALQDSLDKDKDTALAEENVGNSKFAVEKEDANDHVTAELENASNLNEYSPNKKSNNRGKNAVQPKFSSILDSDSEDENIVIAPSRVCMSPLDGDSNSGMSSSPQTQKSVIKPSKSKKNRKPLDSDSEDNRSNDVEDFEAKKSHNVKKSFQTLIDSDSSSSGEGVNASSGKLIHGNQEVKKKLQKKGAMRASKKEAMKQIHCETQRLIRESAVSLPYHRPKQRTFQEFLNRKKFLEELPRGLTTAAKLKMSAEIISKALEKKEKEAVLFFKSSDSEEETIDLNPLRNTNTAVAVKPELTLPEDISIEDTQKLGKNNVQDARNKKEIIQQGALELGVPRKLFSDDFDEKLNNYEDIVLDNGDECSNEKAQQKDKLKENKQARKTINAPRKLFRSGYESNMDYELHSKDSTDGIRDEETAEQTVVALIHSAPREIETADKTTAKDISSVDNSSKSIKSATIKVQSSSNKIVNTCLSRNTEETESSQMDIFETPHTSNADRTSAREEDIISLENSSTEHDKIEVDVLKDTDSGTDKHVIGLPPDFDDDDLKIVKQRLFLTLPNIQPKLKGFPGMVINLSEGDNSNTAANILLRRFFSKHKKVPKQPKTDNPKVIVERIEQTIDGPKTVKEVVEFKASTPEIDIAESTRPGARLQRLREDLRFKMAQKRNEEWKRKEQEMKDEEEKLDDAEDELDNAKEIEEVEEVELSESGESEPEEDDVPIRENKRKECKYLDDEAEVSEDEEDSDDDDDDEEMEIDDGKEGVKKTKRKEAEETEDEDDDEDDDDCADTAEKPKKLKRIIRAFEEDSNMSDAGETEMDIDEMKRTKFPDKIQTDADIFTTNNSNVLWTSDTENDIHVSQPNVLSETSQMCKTPLVKANVLNFVSPITQLTALNTGSESTKKKSEMKTPYSFVGESIPDSIEKILTEKPLRPSLVFDKRMNLQKKLFEEPSDMLNDEELMQLCSGTFATQKVDADVLRSEASKGNKVETQCTGITPDVFSTDKFEESLKPEGVRQSTGKDLVPCTKGTSSSRQNVADSDKPWTRTVIASSSDEEEGSSGITRSKKLKKRKVKKLDFSDEESDEEEEEEKEETDDEQYVDYDSEENEVVVAKKDIQKVAAKFLENEAELSESEWGSEDEDERDLDQLEVEEGDNEEIDEDQMRDQIGKLHAKQVLDEDQRDVRMLKELLFDDGDLHTDGTGRERKFRWRNIDKIGDTDLPNLSDDLDGWDDAPAGENDEQWCKQRHERQKFLDEQKKTAEDEIQNVFTNNGIFKTALKTVSSDQKHNWDRLQNGPKQDESKVPSTLTDLWNNAVSGKSFIRHNVVERFSLLSRDEASLARLAHIARQEDDLIENAIPRFAGVGPFVNENEEESDAEENKDPKSGTDMRMKHRKRKVAAGQIPRASKKLKLNPFFNLGK